MSLFQSSGMSDLLNETGQGICTLLHDYLEKFVFLSSCKIGHNRLALVGYHFDLQHSIQ